MTREEREAFAWTKYRASAAEKQAAPPESGPSSFGDSLCSLPSLTRDISVETSEDSGVEAITLAQTAGMLFGSPVLVVY